MSGAASRVLPVANLREFFRDSLQGALAKQHLAVEDQTEHYVVNLLTLFARSEALYERTPEGMRLRPLVVILCEALEAPSVAERNRALQRLGDVSLSSPDSLRTASPPGSSTSTTTSRWAGAPTPRSRTRPRTAREEYWGRCSPSWRRNSSPWWMP